MIRNMEVKLLGIDNYENMNKIAKEQSQVVSSAGRLSRFKGDVLEIYEKSNRLVRKLKIC